MLLSKGWMEEAVEKQRALAVELLNAGAAIGGPGFPLGFGEKAKPVP